MNDPVKETPSPFLARAGVDRAVVFGVLWKVFNGLFSLATILLIAWRFPKETQGYYYTFSNLVALQVFAELGLGIVITQFSSHYWASLSLNERGGIQGEAGALSRLVSLGRLSLRWYGVAGILAAGGIGFAGLIFFSRSSSDGVLWRSPWILLCVLAGLKMWLVPIWSLLEGCNQVASLYLYRFLSTVASGACTALAILLGWGLWAASAGLGGEFLVGIAYLGSRHRGFVRTFFASHEGPRVDWRKEVFPLQLRIAVTWMAGYFVSSFFTPVLFYFRGAGSAGQWGMTWSMFSMVTSISLIWIVTRAPQFGVWVARREFELLDRQFSRLTRVAFAVAFLGTGSVWAALWALHHVGHPLSARVLDPLSAALLGASVILVNIPLAQSVYLRAHKQEPYLVPTLIQSLLVGLTTILLGKRYGALGVAAGYLAIVAVVVVPWAIVIWIRSRAEWHAPRVEDREESFGTRG